MMSFLAPLFLSGLAALSLPIIFHLIRRTPRGQYAFSSLMFLAPSPPRLTRRSRLDHLLLLLLRATALALLVLAFARPFFREAANLSLTGAPGRRVAIVLDTSASMRRASAWTRAVSHVEQVLSRLEPVDDVALFAFDDEVQTIVDFGGQAGLHLARKAEFIRRRLPELGPNWGGTDVGSALVRVADTLDVSVDRYESDAALQIVLVTDLQRGSRLEALQAYDWPRDVQLAVEQVVVSPTSNASLLLLTVEDESQDVEQPRVRVSNAADSEIDQFYVKWSGAGAQPADRDEIAIYVPPGQSRVVRMPRPAEQRSADCLVLRGDRCDFDNTFYVVPLRQEEVSLVYVGSDAADDPEGPRYYLQLALAETSRRKVQLLARTRNEPLELVAQEPPHLVVVTDEVSEEQRRELERYAEQGGTLLLVPKDNETVISLASFVQEGDELSGEGNAAASDYAMLGEIDFSHPVFASFATPRYSDFTKIHFWRHRHIDIKDTTSARVVARFDNGNPALWEQGYGSGRVFVLASGWHPADSQLALSSKFVPLLSAVLEQAGGGAAVMPNYIVNQPARLPVLRAAANDTVVRKPDAALVKVTSHQDVFRETDQPGIYQVSLTKDQYRFAVNVDSSESDTAPMSVEQFEQYGVRLGSQPTQSEEIERQRQLRDIELEGRQKVWRWLIVVALCLLTCETWLAGMKSRPQRAERSHD